MSRAGRVDIATGDTTPGIAQLLIYESLDLVASTTVNGLVWGITLTLYALCAASLLPQIRTKDGRDRRSSIFMLVYSSVVMICGIIFLGATTHITQRAYVYHNSFPGEPTKYEKSLPDDRVIAFVWSMLSVVLDLLTSAIQIWRLWVIWSSTRYAIAVTALPVLLFAGFIAVDIWANIGNLLHTGRSAAVFKAVLILQLVITVLVTVGIVARLMFVRRRHLKLVGWTDAAQGYMSIVAMLVESYALESVWAFVGMVGYFVRNDHVSIFFLDCIVAIKALAYMLVIYRVSVGRGWEKKTEDKITTLQWNHNTDETNVETASFSSRARNNAIAGWLPKSYSTVDS